MKITHFLAGSIILFFSSCTSNETENPEELSNEWELVILDSIQVDYLADIREGTFENGVGIIKDLMNPILVKFDSTGKILTKKEYPNDGPGTVKWLQSIFINKETVYGTTSFSGIYQFDTDLNLLGTLEMPFMGEARGGAYQRTNFAFWKEKILHWYPGRDGVSPYIDHFYRDHPLLELYDLKTKKSNAVVRIPPTSKYSTDLFHNRPYLNFTIENDSLYLTMSNEALVHVYAMKDSITWVRSMDFEPSDFLLIQGQKDPVSYSQSMQLHEARINAIYSDPSLLILFYHGGIDENTFQNYELKERENFHRYPEFQNAYLKLYQFGMGWSNEVLIPKKVGTILNIESVEIPFYALRNDDYIGEEQDYITFYKLKLVQK